ncbi:MAG: DUF5074 domain-containing protein [Muribaculaceae bacterium]|nr:DUF5074 domain-containing protein [Muribaculaceae bacterium]
MKKSLLTCAALLGLSTNVNAAQYIDWVDWDQIEHWAGDPAGKNKCALVIDFQDGVTNTSCVWGYRWDGTKTGEDLVRAVASQSSILTAMIQYTGTMGSTLNGFGISAGREELDYLHYDFDRAAIGGEVSFGYFEPNISMGQETVPGYEAETMCSDAIANARTTGIIEHPLNAFFYGYPAYDYDYWQLEDGYADSFEYRWRAGWYDGYWSYWHGPNDYEYMSYSGLGMSSTILTDESVQAWKYVVLNGGRGYGDTGGELAEDLDYSMADWGEEMHEAVEPVQPVDQANIDFWVGTGEKAATVVFQFNDSKGPENLVYGYRWTGGWDDDLLTVVKNIAAADPRMTYTHEGSRLVITYDSDHDGAITTKDHNDTDNTWNCYVKRVIDPGFNKVNQGRWLNPNAVMILSHQSAETASVELPYQLFRPALDSEQVITIPREIDYALADKNLELPVFIQVPENCTINTAFNFSTKMPVMNAASVSNLMGKVTTYTDFEPGEGEVIIRGSYKVNNTTTANYVYSNTAHITLRDPERPVTAVHYADDNVDARLNHVVDNSLIFEPADATYTKFNYKSSNPKAATVAAATGAVTTTKTAGQSATISATYDFNKDLTASFDLTTSLQVPVEDITFEGADENNVITLTPKEMIGLFPIMTPADPDIADVNVTIQDNGNNRNDYIATMYRVRLWDQNNTVTQPYELSGHRVGECKIIVKSTDGTDFEKEFTVNVVEPERDATIDYTTGTIMLNEEWFGHTNGGLNWFSPDYDIVYQAYERENPGLSFGCTSQYGVIYDGKLIVSSKQAADNGDPLPGGGRLVVADAASLKRIGSIDDIKLDSEARSGDGRALCGAGPGRVYMGTHQGIYIIDINNCEILGKIGSESSSTNLYSGQIGDMVLAGSHVFAIKQSDGVYVIDIFTDEIVKTIADVNVQGITQSADGSVWYATVESGHSVFVALDHETLEETARVDVPAEYGTVACTWGAWRTTQFTGDHTVNSLFFSGGGSISNGGSGIIYRYDIDEAQFRHIATVSGLPAHTPGMEQAAYGTIRYDYRTGQIIAGTTEFKASGHYRYNWTHFINAETGDFDRSIELKPYYWFQSMPLFPDVHAPEMESIDDISLDLNGSPVEIALNATDADNHDANIHFSLCNSSAASRATGQPVDVTLEGNRLTLTPQAVGQHTFGIAVESNGKTRTYGVNVEVKDTTTGIDNTEIPSGTIYSRGHDIIVNGFDGISFNLIDALGHVVDTFTVSGDRYTRTADVTAGVYIAVGDNGTAKKLIIK